MRKYWIKYALILINEDHDIEYDIFTIDYDYIDELDDNECLEYLENLIMKRCGSDFVRSVEIMNITKL